MSRVCVMAPGSAGIHATDRKCYKWTNYLLNWPSEHSLCGCVQPVYDADMMEAPLVPKSNQCNQNRNQCLTTGPRAREKKERKFVFSCSGVSHRQREICVCSHRQQSDCTCGSKTTYQVGNQQPLPWHSRHRLLHFAFHARTYLAIFVRAFSTFFSYTLSLP